MNSSSISDSDPDAMFLEQVANGDRGAFESLVARYQNLICSVAYSIVGDVKESEDVAQESFVTAWKSLSSLRDRSKFRPWLCGIARNLALKSGCGTRSGPTTELGEDYPDPIAGPDVALMDREEEALVWRHLATLPENYREPLVLFYREDQSVARVAEALGLSEANVRQRLSRGREMLRENVAATIDRALVATKPGRAFTMAVVGALPGVFMVSAGTAAAATTTSVAKTGAAGSAVKAAAGAGWLGGFIGVFGGMFGAWLGHWANLQTARSDRQREFLQGSFRPFVIATLIYVIPLIGLRIMRAMDVAVLSSVLVEALSIWTMLYIAFLIRRSLDVQRRSREILKEDEEAGRTREPTTSFHRFFSRWEGREWVSPAKLFGVPLVHLRFEAQPMQATSMAPWTAAFATPAAHGWIALGGRAHGILFGMGGVASGMIAMGGVAVGGIAFGGLSCGLLSLGGMAIGAAALGGMSLGGWVWGGLAAGWQSFGGMALGWKSAYGGLAISNEYAVGGKAIAAHANDAVAKAVIEEDSFYVLASKLAEWVATPYAFLVIFGISLLPTVVLALVGYRRKAPKIDLESQSGGGDAGCG